MPARFRLSPTAAVQQSFPLHELPLHQAAWITSVGTGTQATAEQARQLAELGFVPGEPVEVVARAWPGGDPLAVRVGQARFALRCAEAACVLVSLQAPTGLRTDSQADSPAHTAAALADQTQARPTPA